MLIAPNPDSPLRGRNPATADSAGEDLTAIDQAAPRQSIKTRADCLS
jgi:hypothetical protein